MPVPNQNFQPQPRAQAPLATRPSGVGALLRDFVMEMPKVQPEAEPVVPAEVVRAPFFARAGFAFLHGWRVLLYKLSPGGHLRAALQYTARLGALFAVLGAVFAGAAAVLALGVLPFVIASKDIAEALAKLLGWSLLALFFVFCLGAFAQAARRQGQAARRWQGGPPPQRRPGWRP